MTQADVQVEIVKKIYFVAERDQWPKNKLFEALKDPYKSIKKIEAVRCLYFNCS